MMCVGQPFYLDGTNFVRIDGIKYHKFPARNQSIWIRDIGIFESFIEINGLQYQNFYCRGYLNGFRQSARFKFENTGQKFFLTETQDERRMKPSEQQSAIAWPQSGLMQ